MIQTQTIDINHVKTVLDNCPHFTKIVHYEYPYGDIMSEKLIDWYRNLIFSVNGNNEKELLLIRALDKSLYLYIRDNKYKRDLRKIITSDELSLDNKEQIKDAIKKIIEFTSNYEHEEIREVSVARWL